MSEENKNCPFCGGLIKIQAKKCKHCGKWLDNSKESSNTESSTQFFKNCRDDMYFNHYKTATIVLSAILGIIILIAAVCLACMTIKKKAPNCEARETKEILINIFKNSYDYKSIEDSTIYSVEVDAPLAESYDKAIDKYTCSAVIQIKSNPGGFRFKEGFYYNKNNYYTSYKTERVEYSSQISEGKTYVLSSTQYGGHFFN